jgi:hypothetical protein
MTQRIQLRDPELDRRYERDGYVVVPGAMSDVVKTMRQIHRDLVGAVPEGFDSTMYSAEADVKEQVHARLAETLAPGLDRLLVEHEVLLTNFVTKRRGDASAMPPHQDWTFVDEPLVSSTNVWVPLVAVDHRNGAISVLPRGHQVPQAIRGSGTPNPFQLIEAEVAAQMVELRMRPGDALVHDHRVLHASPPNRRRRPRLAVACAVLPPGTPTVHYRQVAPGMLERFRVAPEFFREHTYGEEDLPASASSDGPVAWEQPLFALDDLPRSSPV